MTQRRDFGARDPLARPAHLLASPLSRALAVAALLVTSAATAALQTTTAAAAPDPSAPLVPANPKPAAGCDAQSMLAEPRRVGATEAACTAPDLESDQAYLVETARPGATMLRQGSALAIVRLHPMFVRRLTGAIREARAAGLPSAGIFSAYRPPAFGVGGFSDKFNSLHTYGLAVDMLGVGRPGSSEAKLWYEIAARHGIVCPYGAGNRREWNHCQPTRVKSIMAGDPLRSTVSPQGPIDREAMFAMGDALVSGTDTGAGAPELQPTIDEKWLSRNQGQSSPQGAARGGESIGTGHDQAAQSHDRHPRFKPAAAGLLPDHAPHQAHGQPKRGVVAETVSIESGPVKKYRTSSLLRRASVSAGANPASSHDNALAKQIAEENARVNRSIMSICRGC